EPGSLTVAGGPGVTAGVGVYAMTVAATPDFAIKPALLNGYFIDLTPADVPLMITPRPLRPVVTDRSFTYLSPVAAVSWSGLVNDDVMRPVASLNGAPGTSLLAMEGGYGFPKVNAGIST